MKSAPAQQSNVDRLAAFRRRLADDSCLDWSNGAKAFYSSDASIYRVVPTVVAQPRDKAELIRVAQAALAVGLPITCRGAGTSIAGNAVGAGLVIDLGRHLNRVLSLDPATATAVVEPGVVQSVLHQASLPHGLRFGPDPSTLDRCTIGGMIGNNACGSRALGYGRTADNLVSLEVLTGSGQIVHLGQAGDSLASPLPDLRQLVDQHLELIRSQFGSFSRQISGYSLEHLLPENDFAVEKFFAGTEGTLGIVLEATVNLVPDAPVQKMIVLGYPSMPAAADAVPPLLPFQPTAAEGLDARIIDLVRQRKGPAAVPPLPKGDGFLIVEVVGDNEVEVQARAEALLAASAALEGFILADQATAKALWQLRTDAAGFATIALDQPAYPSWEDAAVPPDQLGDYLRGFDKLLAKHGLEGLPYGHFGEGCVHCRIDFPFTKPGGVAIYRAFIEEAADLVVKHGGSMSGEHGDGRARSELLPKMYSPEALQLFQDIKQLWDPQGLLNPGNITDPVAIDAEIRVPQTINSRLRQSDPVFVDDTHRCNGSGKCLALGAANLMCPSYLATMDQFYSTRGRARLLQELVNGELVDGWRDRQLRETFDLCLSCKGCRRDCPTGVDVASYKSRLLFETYRRRLRPASHYSVGWLPDLGRLVTRVPGLARFVNALTHLPGISHCLKAIAGIDPRRSLPNFRSHGPARRQAIDKPALSDNRSRRPVAVWVDSFSDTLSQNTFPATIKVLLAAGFEPQIITDQACCGETWITSGQLDIAKKKLAQALIVLGPIAETGLPIVGLEPSCIAVWKSDAAELLPGDSRVNQVAGAVKTLAQLLSEVDDWQPPDLSDHTIVVQPHCHQQAVLGWQAEADLLKRTKANVVTVRGCCGLAGSFGLEKRHYDLSVKIFNHDLGQAIEAAGAEAIVLADGFGCRNQISDLANRQAMSMAELLAAHL